MTGDDDAAGDDAVRVAAPDAPPTDYSFLADALAAADAVGFVAVGDRFDADLRYLTRDGGFDGRRAFVFTVADPVLVVPDGAVTDAPAVFPGRVVAAGDASSGERAVSTLDDYVADGGTVLAPRALPHDAAVYLERGGYDLASTTAAADARARKSEAEHDCIRFVQGAAVRGMRRAAAMLAASTPDGAVLRWTGAPLSADRLRREVDATLARAGVAPADNTAVVAGASVASADPLRAVVDADAPLEPGGPVVVALAPCGPNGYHGALSRTFAVAGEGGWERRAHVAVRAARRAGLAAIEPGAPARRVGDEVAAELAAHGFEVNENHRGFVGEAGHGVGLSRREPPSLRGDDTLRPGHVLALAPDLYDPDAGRVRVADLVAVTDDGYEAFASCSRSLVPEV